MSCAAEAGCWQVRNEAGEGGRAIVEAFIGGTAFLTLQPLPSGTPFDIFCYAEDIFRAGRKSYGMPYDDVAGARRGVRLDTRRGRCVRSVNAQIKRPKRCNLLRSPRVQ